MLFVTEVDVNAADERASIERLVSRAMRCLTLVSLTIVAAVAWRCDPDVRVTKARSNASAEQWKATALECKSHD